MTNLCPHCGRHNELVSSTSNLKGEPGPPRIPKDGDFGICIECGEWHVFELDAPGKTRKPNMDEYSIIGTDPTFRKIRAAWVASKEAAAKPKEPPKPVPGTQGRALAKGHFHREFDRLKHMGGNGNMPPPMRAAIKGVYAVAVLDIFEQIDRAKSMGMVEGVAFLTQLKKEAQEFATEAGQEAANIGSVKR